MKKVLLAVAFTFGIGAISVSAQSIELISTAGINIATQSIKSVGGEKPKVGFQAGLGVNIPVGKDGFSIQPELNYIQKGVAFKPAGASKTNYNLNYLEIPVLLKYSFGPVYVNAGPSIGFRLGQSNKVKEALGKTKSVDFGLQMGLGAAIPAGPGKLIVDGRYNLGLSNISDVKGENIKNRGFVFSLGYAIPIGK
ncbi:PorT family protein [Elizabethkingia anophelis]|uniref:porin family protein n=1 Tax=Elizabethkingia anophelis TaxID=1117645 RepID=UPI0021A36B61|nr:PorT family protein [Elizabethkingia anophelis]MCT3681294.1 PorT family protein [Elizabethkingia anophelis]MCT3770123.1 PorT family protein [Elizabethkingia anophelis]MCT3780085.1 PorT family protein [Elizabethkingia anophelis]